MVVTTRYPVVLIHGLFGYGNEKPLWNVWPPYWPEKELRAINKNVLVVDVGAVSSDHDRACELFYQLYGGTVDYGQVHSLEAPHARYGRTYDRAMHPTWSGTNPIHLVGHSMGATTAIDFYQLVCEDAFNVGTDHTWVRSITCIAGPLTGSTIVHMCGLHGDQMVPWSTAHILVSVLGIYFKLYHYVPLLRGLYDLKIEQWSQYSLRDVLAVDGQVNASLDWAMYTCQPARRIERNSKLKHMDKLFLMSITTSPRYFHPPKREIALALGILVMLLGKRPPLAWAFSWVPSWVQSAKKTRAVLVLAMVVVLWKRLQKWNFAKMPSLFAMTWLMRRRAKSLHELYNGFDANHWQHNDGAVNIQSMLQPWFPKPQELLASSRSSASLLADAASAATGGGLRGSASTASLRSSSSSSSLVGAATATAAAASVSSTMARCLSHISIDGFHRRETEYSQSDEEEEEEEEEEDDTVSSHARAVTAVAKASSSRFEKGRWYVYRVDNNHLAGTYWDSEAGDLYKSLFAMIIDEYEQEPQDLITTVRSLPRTKTTEHLLSLVDIHVHDHQGQLRLPTTTTSTTAAA